jgi:hypothetical protein
MSIWVLFSGLITLAVVISIITVMYLIKVFPFNKPYQVKDPRNWESKSSTNDWLDLEYNYSPYNLNVPTNYPDASGNNVAKIYCSIDPTRCIADSIQYAKSNPPLTPC